MALRHKITKAQYDALSDELKTEYIAGEKDGEFILDVTGLPEPEDTGPLKRTIESLRNEVKGLKDDKSKLSQQIADMPDVEALKKQHATETAKLTNFVNESLVDKEAFALASRISTAPALLAPIIAKRLTADLSGDKPTTKILGSDGKVADITMEKLGEEFVANKEFAAIIKTSAGRGSGASLNKDRGPGSGMLPAGQGDNQQQAFNAATAKPADLAARIKARKEAAAAGDQA